MALRVAIGSGVALSPGRSLVSSQRITISRRTVGQCGEPNKCANDSDVKFHVFPPMVILPQIKASGLRVSDKFSFNGKFRVEFAIILPSC